ncbi:MAG TPA: divalent-cation tolerance protein CutA [Chthoniobacteraceae bacterium]|nr:divalent-cation tolerance protein CutA [Chthoniobacteraceae bacterium]
MPEELLLVLSTWPDADTAHRASRILVEERLVACANIVPNVESIYRWEGRIEVGAELLVFMKTTVSNYPALERRITELHPYSVPEILGFTADTELPRYGEWVRESCRGAAPPEKGN